MNDAYDKNDGAPEIDVAKMPIGLQIVAWSANKIGLGLLKTRLGRSKMLAATAQAIADNDSALAQRHYAHMHDEKTIRKEWDRLAGFKDQLVYLMDKNLPLFEAVNAQLVESGKPGVNFSRLRLPERELEELRNDPDPDDSYDRMTRYNDLLNKFIYAIVEYCGEFGMALLQM